MNRTDLESNEWPSGESSVAQVSSSGSPQPRRKIHWKKTPSEGELFPELLPTAFGEEVCSIV